MSILDLLVAHIANFITLDCKETVCGPEKVHVRRLLDGQKQLVLVNGSNFADALVEGAEAVSWFYQTFHCDHVVELVRAGGRSFQKLFVHATRFYIHFLAHF